MRRFEPLLVLPLAKLAIHLAAYRGYGIFRDELYYSACAERLAFGYVDHPPLSLALLAVQTALFGDSLLSIRFLPAVAGALTVLVAGLLARELGGGRFAQTLAMTAVGIEFLGVFHIFSMNCFDVLVWATAGWLLAKIVNDGSPKLWLALGALLGLGLQNKISVLWLGAGIAVALVATRERRRLATRWPWLAGALAIVLFLPHVAWQTANGWPTLEFIANATGSKMIEVSPVDFVVGQLELFTFTAVPLWFAGLGWLRVRGHRFGLLGWIYLTVFAILLLSGSSRSGYLGPAYVWLFAAGAVACETAVAELRRPRLRGAVLTAIFAVVLVGGLVYLPFSLPVLPVERYIPYAASLGEAPSTEERKELAELGQFYADMHGWETLVEVVAQVYDALPPEERAVAGIFAPNYGNAGAIDYFGAEHGLPPAVSGHNNYWLWGPRGTTGEVMIVIDGDRDDLERRFERAELAATVDCDYCMPYEDEKPIWVGRGLRAPLEAIWPQVKHFD